VLIDLKIGNLDHKNIGQMNFYLNYIKDKEVLKDENPPVGIILCTESKIRGQQRPFTCPVCYRK